LLNQIATDMYFTLCNDVVELNSYCELIVNYSISMADSTPAPFSSSFLLLSLSTMSCFNLSTASSRPLSSSRFRDASVSASFALSDGSERG
jgi:hypothetical protein